MIRFLPFILILLLVLGGFGYWRYSTSKQNLSLTPETVEQDQVPVEVPKTLPNASLEDRIKSLEDTIGKLVPQVNSLKVSASPTSPSTSLDSRLGSLEAAVTELKARVTALEKPTSSSSVSKAPLYIPMGGSGGPWLYADWTTLNEYQVSINADDYAGYSSMQLEANFRLIGNPGTGYVRIYNLTDKSAVASDINTTSTSFSVLTSATFKLTSGQKLYAIQVKSTQSQDLYIQSARIKVNF